jgi:hypothetical protein
LNAVLTALLMWFSFGVATTHIELLAAAYIKHSSDVFR